MCLSHFANSLGKIKMTYLVVLHLGYEVMRSYYTLSSQLSSTAFNPALEKLVFIQLVYSFFYLFNAVKALLDCKTALPTDWIEAVTIPISKMSPNFFFCI